MSVEIAQMQMCVSIVRIHSDSVSEDFYRLRTRRKNIITVYIAGLLEIYRGNSRY